MEYRLIPDSDRIVLQAAPSTTFAAERERIRSNTNTPLTWRLCPSFIVFYNPVGMSAEDIMAYEAPKKAEQRNKELALKALKAVVIAVHKRFKTLIPTDTTTVTQWETFIRAEWDALN